MPLFWSGLCLLLALMLAPEAMHRFFALLWAGMQIYCSGQAV